MREAFFKMEDLGIWSLVSRGIIREGSKNRVPEDGWCTEYSRDQERWREPLGGGRERRGYGYRQRFRWEG